MCEVFKRTPSIEADCSQELEIPKRTCIVITYKNYIKGIHKQSRSPIQIDSMSKPIIETAILGTAHKTLRPSIFFFQIMSVIAFVR